jgi:hypothetical protein
VKGSALLPVREILLERDPASSSDRAPRSAMLVCLLVEFPSPGGEREFPAPDQQCCCPGGHFLAAAGAGLGAGLGGGGGAGRGGGGDATRAGGGGGGGFTAWMCGAGGLEICGCGGGGGGVWTAGVWTAVLGSLFI